MVPWPRLLVLVLVLVSIIFVLFLSRCLHFVSCFAGHHHGVDYWALGILIYEMLSGYSPFADHVENSQVTIYKNIIAGKYSFPSFLTDNVAKDLVRKLLIAKDSKVCVCGLPHPPCPCRLPLLANACNSAVPALAFTCNPAACVCLTAVPPPPPPPTLPSVWAA